MRRYTANMYLDSRKPVHPVIAAIMTATMVMVWAKFTQMDQRMASVFGSFLWFVGESLWNTRVKKPYNGELSTRLQFFLNCLMVPTLLWFSSLGGPFLSPILFCLGLWSMEVVQVALATRLYGGRPWAKYEGPDAYFNGSIMLRMGRVWLILGIPAYYAWIGVIWACDWLLN